MNKEKFKRFNRNIFVSLFFIVFVIFSFNLIVDPYNIFDFLKVKKFNFYKPEIKRQERMTKYMGLKVAKNIDTLFVGSSIPDWSLNPEYYYKLTNKKAYNMGIVHADFNEFREIIYKSILIHPEIKTILLSLELEILIPIPKIKNYDLEKYNTNLTFREVSSVFLS